MQHLFPISNYASGYIPLISNILDSDISIDKKITWFESMINLLEFSTERINTILTLLNSGCTNCEYSILKLELAYLTAFNQIYHAVIDYFINQSEDSSSELMLAYYTEHIPISELAKNYHCSSSTIKKKIHLYTRKAIENYETY